MNVCFRWIIVKHWSCRTGTILKTSVCMQLSEGGPVMVEEESDSDDEPPEIVMVPHTQAAYIYDFLGVILMIGDLYPR